ncbi:hypothetical protein RDI58_021866 [Solanum bulbocastanum]|uniref:Uncharacterized protein n=1 Tax=Solanum bulbocastanum TaxID=147425 RepID=A0AAN8Y5A7_SOLBU
MPAEKKGNYSGTSGTILCSNAWSFRKSCCYPFYSDPL